MLKYDVALSNQLLTTFECWPQGRSEDRKSLTCCAVPVYYKLFDMEVYTSRKYYFTAFSTAIFRLCHSGKKTRGKGSHNNAHIFSLFLIA